MKAPPYSGSWSWSGAGATVSFFVAGAFDDMARWTGSGAALWISGENERIFRGCVEETGTLIKQKLPSLDFHCIAFFRDRRGIFRFHASRARQGHAEDAFMVFQEVILPF